MEINKTKNEKSDKEIEKLIYEIYLATEKSLKVLNKQSEENSEKEKKE